MPLQATSGAASYDAFGGGAAAVPQYIEDVFSTWLYTGNGSSQTITNNIDLSTKGGLVWIKNRGGYSHALFDTTRGVENLIKSNTTEAQSNLSGSLTNFTTSGFSVGSAGIVNDGSGSYPNNVSWTFREQPKFFDVVTYTGTDATQTISHNLGSTPGCIIIKKVDSISFNAGWYVYHRSLTDPNMYYLRLETTQAQTNFNDNFISNVTSTTFTVNGTSGGLGLSGSTYVAYLFAHNAGGFGLTGTDNVISCGSFTTDGSGNATVSLGYEPQWLLIKSVTFGGWWITDTMRGMSVASGDNVKALFANTSGAEANANEARPNATGFTVGPSGNLSSSDTFIYIAIRRGPMKVPTSGTSVYNAIARTGTGTVANITGVGFPPDLLIDTQRAKTGDDRTFAFDRLRGPLLNLVTNETAAEASTVSSVTSFGMDGVAVDGSGRVNANAQNYINWFFKRAPSVFDEVCYTGTGAAGLTVAHNLTVAPELIIVKSRSLAGEQWPVYASPITVLKVLQLNTTIAATTYSDYWNNTAPTSSVFSVGSTSTVNQSAATYVAYLFATCPGVSKVGSYTGNGTTQTIDCGFGAGGVRFVIIKRTDATGDWYVYDTTRGMTVLTDPYLLLNSIAAETATLGSVTTVSTGFALNSTILAAINVNAGSYIFLAFA